MWKSPIEIMQTQMRMQMEDDIVKAVHNYGVVVDKEELLKALKYDREQYEKGYQEDMLERYIPIMKHGSSQIKDSGDRTQFFDANGNEIGRRDMHTGKGRMDLLPVTAIIELSKHCENGALKYGERNVDKGIPQHSFIDSGLRHMFKYLRGDKDENHLVAAAWNIMWALEQEVNKPELNDLPWSNKEKQVISNVQAE